MNFIQLREYENTLYLFRTKITVRRSVKVRPNEIVHLSIGDLFARDRLSFGSFCIILLAGIVDRVIARPAGFPHIRQQHIPVTERRIESRVALQSYIGCR